MDDEDLVYRRAVTNVRSWTDFSTGHIAFSLHRVTGWLLLGWVLLHLAVPMIGETAESVYSPTGTVEILLVMSVAVFHAFNGLRLVVIELGSVTAQGNRVAFWLTAILSLLIIVSMGVAL